MSDSLIKISDLIGKCGVTRDRSVTSRIASMLSQCPVRVRRACVVARFKALCHFEETMFAIVDDIYAPCLICDCSSTKISL